MRRAPTPSFTATPPPSAKPTCRTRSPAPRVEFRSAPWTFTCAIRPCRTYYFGIEHQFLRDLLFRINYQGSQGRHLPVLMNLNRYDGLRYNPNLTATPPPNPLYTGFNYRANNVNSHYNSMVLELQKRMSRGLPFQFGDTWSKLDGFRLGSVLV